jgi:hypothetical protein
MMPMTGWPQRIPGGTRAKYHCQGHATSHDVAGYGVIFSYVAESQPANVRLTGSYGLSVY